MNNIVKYTLTVALFMLAFLCSAQDIYRVTASTTLNVRSAPNTNSVVLGTLKRSENIISLNVDNGWVEFVWKDRLAYASSKYVEYVSPAPQTDTLYIVAYEAKMGQTAFVRESPTTSSRAIGYFKNGEYIIPDKIEAGWASVVYKGQVGYVIVNNLSRVLYKKPLEKTVEQSAPEDEVKDVPDENSNSGVVDVIPMRSKKKAALSFPAFIDDLPDFLIAAPVLNTDKCSLYLSARLGLGGSCFNWNNGPVSGRFSFAFDAVAQLYLNNQISFIPKGYYVEGALGYAMKGAASLPMHYIDLHMMPFGYAYDLSDSLRAVGKLGIYTGIPVSVLEHIHDSNVDAGVSVGAMVEYKMLSAGLTFDHGFTKVAPGPVELYNWGLMFQVTCKLLSFK